MAALTNIERKIVLISLFILLAFNINAQTIIGEINDSEGGLWAKSEYNINKSDTMFLVLIRDAQNPFELKMGSFGFFGTNNYLILKKMIETNFGSNKSFEIPMPLGKVILEYSGNFLVMTWLEKDKDPVVKITKKECATLFKKLQK